MRVYQFHHRGHPDLKADDKNHQLLISFGLNNDLKTLKEPLGNY